MMEVAENTTAPGLKQVGGVWLPLHERHMDEHMRATHRVVDGRLTYQYEKLAASMNFVRNWRTSVDVGAHVGTWSMHLARRFARLVAFEPVALHRECLRLNLMDAAVDIDINACALGDMEGRGAMRAVPGSSGDCAVMPGDEVPIHLLDSFGIPDVDFLKIDCAGHELPVVRGALATLERCRPCISIEQKPARTAAAGHPERGAITLLESLGARVVHEHGHVYTLTWKKTCP